MVSAGETEGLGITRVCLLDKLGHAPLCPAATALRLLGAMEGRGPHLLPTRLLHQLLQLVARVQRLLAAVAVACEVLQEMNQQRLRRLPRASSAHRTSGRLRLASSVSAPGTAGRLSRVLLLPRPRPYRARAQAAPPGLVQHYEAADSAASGQ